MTIDAIRVPRRESGRADSAGVDRNTMRSVPGKAVGYHPA
jgi:hypothetical protein